MSSRSSADSSRCRRRPRSRSTSISSAASAATCSSRRWSTRCRRSRAAVLAELAAVRSARATARRIRRSLEWRLARAALRPRAGVASDRLSRPSTAAISVVGARGERAFGHRVCVASPSARDAPLSAPTREHALALLALLADAEAQRARHRRRRRALPRARGLGFAARRRRGRLHRGQLAGARWTAYVAAARRRHRAHRARRAARAGAGDEPAARRVIRGTTTASPANASRRPAPRSCAISCPRSDAVRGATPGRLLGTGSGAGTRTLPGLPNIVRALVLERAASRDADTGIDSRRRVGARVRRRRHDGRGDRGGRRPPAHASQASIDVSIGTRHGKKGRPLAEFRVLARPDAADGDRAGVLHRNVDARAALARRAPARAAPDRSRRRRSTARRSRSKIADRPAASARAKAAHDDVAATRGLGARRRTRGSGGALEARRQMECTHAPFVPPGGTSRRRPARASSRRSTAHDAARGRRERRRGLDDARPRRVAIRARATTMYHATGPAVPAAARGASKRTRAATAGRWSLLDAGEQADARYRANPVDRCYYCKTNLYARIRERRPDTIASGTNRDDLDDFRPGLRAATRARRRASVCRGRHRQGGRVRARRAARPRRSRAPSGAAVPREPRGDRDRHRGRRSRVHRCRRDAPRRAPRARSGASLPRDARGIVIELVGGATIRGRTALAHDIGADACAAEGRDVRRRAALHARRGVPAQGRRWMSFASTGSAPSAPGRARRCCASRSPRRRSTRSSRTPATLDRRLLLTRLGPRKFGRLVGAGAPGASTTTKPRARRSSAVCRRRARLRRVAIVCGGTSDLAVAGEAARTLAFAGEKATLARRRRRRRTVAAHGAPRRDPPASRGHRRGRHGRRALQRARRPRSVRGDRRADVGRLRRGRGRPHGAERGARELRIRALRSSTSTTDSAPRTPRCGFSGKSRRADGPRQTAASTNG